VDVVAEAEEEDADAIKMGAGVTIKIIALLE
jgi:hypothetical protein